MNSIWYTEYSSVLSEGLTPSLQQGFLGDAKASTEHQNCAEANWQNYLCCETSPGQGL